MNTDNKPEITNRQHNNVINFCDHVKNDPKLFKIPSHHKKRSLCIQETVIKIGEAYFKPRLSLKNLQFHSVKKYKVRSQRREAHIVLLQAMTYYQDDATGRIGIKMNDGTFKDLSIKRLAHICNIKLKRATRALKDIIKAGYISIKRHFKRDEETGRIISYSSIRHFLPKFYIDLDIKGKIWQKTFSQRNYARDRQEKKIMKSDKKRAQAMMGLIKENICNTAKKMTNKIMGTVKKIPVIESNSQAEKRKEHEKKLISKAMELFNLDPSKTISQYYTELKSKYPPPH